MREASRLRIPYSSRMKRAPASGNDAAVAPRVRRGYFESRFGQLHVHNAMPPGGGFEEATALLCLHTGASSARMFRGFLEIMGRDRSTYAPDIPGYGESDAPPPRATVADYAGGIGDFIDSMRFRQIDLLGYHAGAAIAAELAVAKQQIRRLVLIGVPLYPDAEREAFRRSPVAAAPADGSWGANALMQYPMRDRLASITQPVMVLRPRDDLWDATARTREVLPRVRVVDLPDQGRGLFDVAPQVVAEAIRDFLKG